MQQVWLLYGGSNKEARESGWKDNILPQLKVLWFFIIPKREPFKLSENDKNKKFSKEEMLSLYIDNRNRMDIHPLLAYYLFS